ncbi:AAA family ATPase [Pseudomonas sp. GWSMS-1]|uniref:AAA family ATPase n=1 Tax=Pseudomonas sp. GWSMS-1 TaxID=3308997 RepID=UPI003CE90F07
MKVLVLTGPESSGKSWLAEEIQMNFGGQLVGEYVRYFIEREQRDTCYADITTIAQGQLAWEDQARAARPELLILDTHLLSNLLWSQALFGDCPSWIEHALLERDYHLHLLLDPVDAPWVDDGQRCQPELAQRLAFYQQCEGWLQRHQQPMQCIQGNWTQRREQTLKTVEHWLNSTQQHTAPGQ